MEHTSPFHKRFRRMRFNRKMILAMVSMIMTVALIVLILFSVATVRTIRQQSVDMSQQQLRSLTAALDSALSNCETLVTFVISDSSVQEYLRYSAEEAQMKGKNLTHLSNEIYSTLSYTVRSNPFLEYVAIQKDKDNTILYQGHSWNIVDFQEQMNADYLANRNKTGYTISITKNPFNKSEYTINLYQDVYNRYNFNQKLGLFVISVNCVRLNESFAPDPGGEAYPLEISLMDSSGLFLYANGSTGKTFPLTERLTGTQGSFTADNTLYVYRKIPVWDLYVLGAVPMSELMNGTYNTVRLLILVIIGVCFLSAAVCGKVCNGLYRPLGDLSEKMKQVTSGDLRTRMAVDGLSEDLEKIAVGFNEMISRIGQLMEQVREEQKQLERIELNALQSQIKPHFLYNTLDCIHWQALMDGNKEISTMVKALATYYRICLSQGNDIIPLEQEIAHVKSYLIIQNMRYSDIIETDFSIDEEFSNLPIPKMTLQPLVENSIYHGIKVKQGFTGLISIRVRSVGGDAVISVRDSGTGMTPEKIEEINNSISVYDESFGYGVRNVHKRIEILFGKGYGLHYASNALGGVTVEIRLPLKNPEKEGASDGESADRG